MDDESHSTSQDSSNSRESVQMITNVLFHVVNLREVHCALCETIYLPENEANRHLNVCQNCEVWLERYNEESWQVLGESRQRAEESLRGLVETWRDLEETRPALEENRQNLVEIQRDLEEFRQRFEPHRERIEQGLMESWRDLEETWLDLEENRRNLQETQQDLEEARQRVEPHQQRVEQGLIEAWRDLEETWPDLEENRWDLEETQRDSEEFRQRFEPHRQRVERPLEGLPRVIITEEHETLRDLEENLQRVERPLEGLPRVIITEEHETLRDLEETVQRVERPLEGLPRVIITEEHEKKHNGLECAICMDPLSVGSIVNQLPCLHFFHPLCIVPWLKVRMSCPTCRYKLSSAFHIETRQNSNRRIGFQGSNVNSSSATYDVNEPEVVVSESYNETTDSSVRDREGSRGGWFLFAAAPIVSLVGIALVECFQNFLGDGRGRGSTNHDEFPRQCQQQVRMFSSGSSSTRTSNSRENN